MAANTREPKYNGISVYHPTTTAAAETLLKQGKSKQEIMAIVGIPGERVDQIARGVKKP